MSRPAAVKAVFADWKVIKTRATVQLVFELPIEKADEAYQALGGMPIAAREVWCGIARLNGSAADPAPTTGKTPAQIAGYLCTLPKFHKFLQEGFTTQWRENYAADASNEEIAAGCVRDLCTVASRSEIKPDNKEWNALRVAFQLWEREPEIVE